jgi:hypothetical protein
MDADQHAASLALLFVARERHTYVLIVAPNHTSRSNLMRWLTEWRTDFECPDVIAQSYEQIEYANYSRITVYVRQATDWRGYPPIPVQTQAVPQVYQS